MRHSGRADGSTIESPSGVAGIVIVRSPDGEQESEPPVRERVTVTGITGPTEVGVVGVLRLLWALMGIATGRRWFCSVLTDGDEG